MLALRYIYVLTLVVWLGGMFALGALVAPTIFQVLQAHEPVTGRALGGEVFGAILARFHYVAYAAGGLLLVTLFLMRLLGPPPPAFGVRVAIVTRCSTTSLYSGVIVSAADRRGAARIRRRSLRTARERRAPREVRRASRAFDAAHAADDGGSACLALLGSEGEIGAEHVITLIPGDGIGPEVTQPSSQDPRMGRIRRRVGAPSSRARPHWIDSAVPCPTRCSNPFVATKSR